MFSFLYFQSLRTVRMKSNPKTPPSKKVLDGRVTKQNIPSSPLENSKYMEVISKLRDELLKKDEQLKRTEKELRETKGILNGIARKNKIFYRFPKLPTELRHLIYSKLPLIDRVAAVKACPDMAAYFKNNRLKRVEAKMSLEEENDKAYVRIEYRRQKYMEMYRVPDEILTSVERDLASSRGCGCANFCDQERFDYPRRKKKVPPTLYFECTPENMAIVFDTFALIDLKYLTLKTAPVGGLVDLVQPAGLHPKSVTLTVTWHLQDNVIYPRNDPNFVAKNWGRWLDYLHPNTMSINDNSGKFVPVPPRVSDADDSDSDSDETSYYVPGPDVFVTKELYDLPAMQNLQELYQECSVDISYRQLINMRATSISLFKTQSLYLSPVDLLEFYKLELQAWLLAPNTEFHYHFRTSEKPDNPPCEDHERLLENVREQLKSPDFRVYPNYYMFNPDFVDTKSITIRSMKSRPSLVICDGIFSTGVPHDYSKKHVWPEKHGIEL